MDATDSPLDWVLTMAPYRRDAEHLETLLTHNGLPVRRAEGVQELTALLEQGPGVLVATHEALNPQVLEVIRRHLIDQPEWSEMPLVILLDRAVPQARIRAELSGSLAAFAPTLLSAPCHDAGTA
ncbi:hypothetical protein ACVI55_006440 [Sinorhizobium medicae]